MCKVVVLEFCFKAVELVLLSVEGECMMAVRDKPIYDVLEIAIPRGSHLHVKMNETQKRRLNTE